MNWYHGTVESKQDTQKNFNAVGNILAFFLKCSRQQPLNATGPEHQQPPTCSAFRPEMYATWGPPSSQAGVHPFLTPVPCFLWLIHLLSQSLSSTTLVVFLRLDLPGVLLEL